MTLRLTLTLLALLPCCAAGGCTSWLLLRQTEQSKTDQVSRSDKTTERHEPTFDATGGFYTPWAHLEKSDLPTAKREPSWWLYQEPETIAAHHSSVEPTIEQMGALLPAAPPIVAPGAPAVGPTPALVPITELPAPIVAQKPKEEHQSPLVEALDCILRNKHNEALQHLQKYDAATQEVFLRLLPVMALMTQKPLDQLSPAEIAVLHEQLHSLLATIRPRTELRIDKICFCEWIKNYGIYKPLPEGHAFLRSTPSRPGELVQLYVEVRNFASEPRDGFYETRLSSKVEIRPQGADPASEPTWFYNFPDRQQTLRSRTMLHDYFNYYSFTVPNNIPAGVYTLTIQITDETRPDQPRVVRKSTEFRVTSVAPRGS